MLTFKALHILSMIAMVTIEIGSEFLYAFAISRRDVRGLATVHRLLEQARAGPASIAALVSGVVFGLLTAATGGFDFLDGWLIAAYVLSSCSSSPRPCSSVPRCDWGVPPSRRRRGKVRATTLSARWPPIGPSCGSRSTTRWWLHSSWTWC